jgi:hypothetical protein
MHSFGTTFDPPSCRISAFSRATQTSSSELTIFLQRGLNLASFWCSPSAARMHPNCRRVNKGDLSLAQADQTYACGTYHKLASSVIVSSSSGSSPNRQASFKIRSLFLLLSSRVMTGNSFGTRNRFNRQHRISWDPSHAGYP